MAPLVYLASLFLKSSRRRNWLSKTKQNEAGRILHNWASQDVNKLIDCHSQNIRRNFIFIFSELTVLQGVPFTSVLQNKFSENFSKLTVNHLRYSLFFNLLNAMYLKFLIGFIFLCYFLTIPCTSVISFQIWLN